MAENTAARARALLLEKAWSDSARRKDILAWSDDMVVQKARGDPGLKKIMESWGESETCRSSAPSSRDNAMLSQAPVEPVRLSLATSWLQEAARVRPLDLVPGAVIQPCVIGRVRPPDLGKVRPRQPEQSQVRNPPISVPEPAQRGTTRGLSWLKRILRRVK